MGTLTIHAGDFPRFDKGLSTFDGTYFAFPVPEQWEKQNVSFKELVSVDIITEQTVRQGMGPLGRGLVGMAIAGGAGLVLGALSSKNESSITFIAKFRDGRELLGTCEHGTFVAMKAALMDRDRRPLPLTRKEQRSKALEARREKQKAEWEERSKALEARREKQKAEGEARREKEAQEEQELRAQGYTDDQIAAIKKRRLARSVFLWVLTSALLFFVTYVLPGMVANGTSPKSESVGQARPASVSAAQTLPAALPPLIDRQSWTAEAVAKFLDDNPDAKITSAWAVKSENLVWVCAVGSSQFIARSTVSNPRGSNDFQFVKDDASNQWQKLCREPGRNDMLSSAQTKPDVGTPPEIFERQLVEQYYGAVTGVWTSSQGIVCGRLQDGRRWWIVEPGSSAPDAIVMEGTPDEGAFHGPYGSWALYCS